MKNILVLMHDDPGQEARLQAALDVTRALEGHLTCVDVAIMPILMGDFYSGAGEAMLLEDERTRESDNRAAIEARLAHEQISWNWIETTGAIAPSLVDQAGLADLIVVNRKLDAAPLPDMLAATSEVAVKAGKPILAVPDLSRGINLSGTALICWDGSPACDAALQAAIPLLRFAETVTLNTVDDGSIATPPEDAASYLSRHGISAVIRRETAAHGKAAALIFDAIHLLKADYVVMGGFGHGRLTEALFGGVSRAMLSGSPVPVFLAH
ncbi:universal stress protein [Sphingomonas sp. MMS24-J13]|uniref:universal stress protein n=1 Tax=Sphingomonas sp. MMS24-J13 TaxID=3238686 RepID=UPI00384D75C8